MAESLPAPQPRGTLSPAGRLVAVPRSRHGTDRPPRHRRPRGRRGPQPGSPGPAHRHGARPAGHDREGLRLPRRAGPPAWRPPRRRHHRRHGARRAGRGLQGAPGAAPLSRLDGRTGAGGLPHRGRGLRQQGRQHLEGRAQRRRAPRPAQGPPRLRRAEGQDLRRPAGQAAGRPSRRVAGRHRPLRRRGDAPVGGRHHQPREPREGAGDQAGDEGQGARRA